MPMDRATLRHAKSAKSRCTPCVITSRQQASVILLAHCYTDRQHTFTVRLKLHLVLLTTFYRPTNKSATNSQQIELMELEPYCIASFVAAVRTMPMGARRGVLDHLLYFQNNSLPIFFTFLDCNWASMSAIN